MENMTELLFALAHIENQHEYFKKKYLPENVPLTLFHVQN